MKFILFVIFISAVSLYGNSQFYYSYGLKTQRANFFAVYETEEEYGYDFLTDSYTYTYGRDTVQDKLVRLGPTLIYGCNFELTNHFSVGAELEGFMGMLKLAGNEGFYMDFGLGVRGSYVLNSDRYSNLYLRLGAGYGMYRYFNDHDVLGLNWRLGYEHDFDIFRLGVALDGNMFVEDLSYDATSRQEFLLERKLSSIGFVVYFSFGEYY